MTAESKGAARFVRRRRGRVPADHRSWTKSSWQQPLSHKPYYPPTSSSPSTPMRLYVRALFKSPLQSHLCSCGTHSRVCSGPERSDHVPWVPAFIARAGRLRLPWPWIILCTVQRWRETETPWPPCRQRSPEHTDITVCPLFDFFFEFFCLVFYILQPFWSLRFKPSCGSRIRAT